MLDVDDLKLVFLEKLERTKSLDEAFTKAVWIAYKEGIKAGKEEKEKCQNSM